MGQSQFLVAVVNSFRAVRKVVNGQPEIEALIAQRECREQGITRL